MDALLYIVLGLGALMLALLARHLHASHRERLLFQLLDRADALEQLLQQTRERMRAMQQVVGRVPDDIGAVARASLAPDELVRQGLRDVLEHRLWISRHGQDAKLGELRAARAAMQRAHERIQSQLDRLESAGAELASATQAAIEQAAREPAALRRGQD